MVGPLFFLLVVFGEILSYSYSTQITDSHPGLSAMTLTEIVVYIKMSLNMFDVIDSYTTGVSIATNVLATSLISYKLWSVNFFLRCQ